MSLRKQDFTSGATRESYITVDNIIVHCGVPASGAVGFSDNENSDKKKCLKMLQVNFEEWRTRQKSEVTLEGKETANVYQKVILRLEIGLHCCFSQSLLWGWRKEHEASTILKWRSHHRQSTCCALLCVRHSGR